MFNMLALLQDSAGVTGDVGADAMARQPEAAAQIQTGSIILAALIEGAALFALVIAGFIK